MAPRSRLGTQRSGRCRADLHHRLGGYNNAPGLAHVNIGCVLANDECATATPIALGTNSPFSTVGATSSLPLSSCGSSVGNDVWFAYTATCSAPTMFSTCSPTRTFDTMLELFSGTCGALANIGCNDDACSLGSRVTAPLRNGQTCWLRIGGTNGTTGSFDLDVEIGTGTGSFVMLGGACGPLGIRSSDSSNIGGTFTIPLSGVTGLPVIGYWLPPGTDAVLHLRARSRMAVLRQR